VRSPRRPPPARVDVAGAAVSIVASAPVANQVGAQVGQVVVTVAADLAATPPRSRTTRANPSVRYAAHHDVLVRVR
jgi:uncharacterized protein YcfJ